MPSLLAESEPATNAGASQRLRTTMAAVRIMFIWLGVRKSLNHAHWLGTVAV